MKHQENGKSKDYKQYPALKSDKFKTPYDIGFQDNYEIIFLISLPKHML